VKIMKKGELAIEGVDPVVCESLGGKMDPSGRCLVCANVVIKVEAPAEKEGKEE